MDETSGGSNHLDIIVSVMVETFHGVLQTTPAKNLHLISHLINQKYVCTWNVLESN